MKTLYVCLRGDNGQEEVREYDVDDDAVPFTLVGECPHCKGCYITKIDRTAMVYECGSWALVNGQCLTVPGSWHAIPPKTATFDGQRMVVNQPYERR